MKSIKILAFSSMLFAGPSLFAQKSNVIKINILSPIVRTFNVQFEHKFNAKASGQLGFFYTGYSVSGTSFSGIGITPEYRFYLSETEAPQGVYVAPFFRYQNFTLKSGSDRGTLSTVGGGLILGKQWLFNDKIAMDMFFGPSYSSGDVKVTAGSDSFSTGAFSGFGLRLGVCFGFAF